MCLLFDQGGDSNSRSPSNTIRSQVEEVTAAFHRVEELLGKLFEDKREAREWAE